MFFQDMMKCLLEQTTSSDCYTHMLIHNSMHYSLLSQENRNKSRCLTEKELNIRNIKVLEWAVQEQNKKG